MVQVLAFVMMLLAMAVFVLSQNVSKSAVQAIAKAAKMDVPKDANVAQLTSLVIAELDRLKAKPAPRPEPSPETAKADEANPEAPRLEASRPDAPKAGDGMPDSAKSADVKPDAPNPNSPNPNPAKPEAAKDEAAPSAAEGSASPISPAPGARAAAAAKSIPRPADGKAATLRFSPRGFKLEPSEDETLGKFLEDGHFIGANAPLVIRAYAAASEGALSEARRLAYYRAMSVRKALTDRKLQAGDIRILILDTQDKAQGATADVFADEAAKK